MKENLGVLDIELNHFDIKIRLQTRKSLLVYIIKVHYTLRLTLDIPTYGQKEK